MIFYLALACMYPPESLTIPKHCFVVGATEGHAKAIAMARRWCQGDADCESMIYLQQLEVKPGYETLDSKQRL